ncbi:DUF368 domain-containing protein [Candidatus Woesearchaeota archaeon B3_Woes]|nr:MAG: DUF368 domain-containing protein [Candidatus Woesearchaeota archaeon B3_Woes]
MRNILETFLVMLRGFFMGIADIIPGVSGGTIALITGIYSKLIDTVSKISDFVLSLIKLDKKNIKKNFKKIDFWFILPLIIGIALAFLILSGVITFMLKSYTASTYSFFFGLILASSYFVYKKIKKINTKTITFFVIGLIFAFFFVDLGVTDKIGHSYSTLFFSGALAICAMILPGISGAFILLLLGQYEYVLNIIHNLEILKIIIFIIGAGTGLLLFSKLLNYLLKKHKSPTMAFLTGLMLGSLRLPYQNITQNLTSPLPSIIIVLIGFFLVIILESSFNK